MGILDKLKFRKSKSASKETPTKQTSQKPTPDGELKKSETPAVLPSGKDTGSAYQLLRRPILSEKGTHLAASGQYVFEVQVSANKSEIKKSIQKVYSVHVESVRIIKVPSKSRRYGRTTGKTSARKKAVVTVRQGEHIPGIVESVG